jgi:hypothetical protein
MPNAAASAAQVGHTDSSPLLLTPSPVPEAFSIKASDNLGVVSSVISPIPFVGTDGQFHERLICY